MRRTTPAFAAVLALAPVSAAAQDYVPPKAGAVVTYQSWRSNDNDPAMRTPLPPFRIEIRSIEGDFAVTRVEENDRFLATTVVLRGVLTVQASFDERHTRIEGEFAPIRALWPFAVGKTAEIELKESHREGPASNGAGWQPSGRTLTYRFRVVGQEDITLPAGQFRAWVIERDVFARTGNAPNTRIEQSRTWFAPSLGWWVKFEHRAPDGPGTRLTVREAAAVAGN